MTESEPQESGDNYRVESGGVHRGSRVGSAFMVSVDTGREGGDGEIIFQEREMAAGLQSVQSNPAKAEIEDTSSSSSCCACTCKVMSTNLLTPLLTTMTLPSGYQGHPPLLHHPHCRPGHHGPRHTLRLQLRHQADTDGELLEEHDQHYQGGRQPGVSVIN